MFFAIGDAAGFCADTKEIWKFAGTVVTIFKILIPVILIILGIIGLGKAVISADDKDIKTAVNSFIKKAIVGICIFFIPTIVSAIFNLVDGASSYKADYQVCVKCITNHKTC